MGRLPAGFESRPLRSIGSLYRLGTPIELLTRFLRMAAMQPEQRPE